MKYWSEEDEQWVAEDLSNCLPSEPPVRSSERVRRPRTSVDKALDCIELWMKADVELFKDAPFRKNLEHRLRTVRALRRILKRPSNVPN